MKKYIVLVVIALVFMGLTLQGAGGQKAALKQAVENYNQKLIVSLKQGDGALMSEVAVRLEVDRVKLFISFLADNNQLLDGKLAAFDVTDSETDSKPFSDGPTELIENYGQQTETPNNPQSQNVKNRIQSFGRVSAGEKWIYQYLNVEDNRPAGQAEEISYLSVYYLVKDDTGWKVAGLKTQKV